MANKGLTKKHVTRLKDLERKYSGSTVHDLTKLIKKEDDRA